MAFVANLQKQYLRQQFALFCWVHMTLLVIVVSRCVDSPLFYRSMSSWLMTPNQPFYSQQHPRGTYLVLRSRLACHL